MRRIPIITGVAAALVAAALYVIVALAFEPDFRTSLKEGVPRVARALLGGAEATAGGDGTAGWETTTVDADAGRYGGKCSLALDRRGRPHIAYWSNGMEPYISYARWDGEGWRVQMIDDSIGRGDCELTMRLDREDRPHIVYGNYFYDKSTPPSCDYAYACKYARLEGDKWYVAKVIAGPGSLRRLALALDNDGAAHLALVRSENEPGGCDELSYGRYDGNAWEWESLTAARVLSEHLSIFLASGTEPRVLCGKAYFVALEGRWEKRSVPYEGSAAVDAPGRLHFAFRDDGLIYARRTENGWKKEPVDAKWGAGFGASLALDRDGLPYISYRNRYDLRFAHFTGEEWVVHAVEEFNRPAERDIDTWLAVDDEGRPAIAYFDDFSGSLKCARWRGGEWRNSTPPEADNSKDLTAAGEIVSWYLQGAAFVPADPRHPRRLLNRVNIQAEPDEQAEVLLRIREPTEGELLSARSVRKSRGDMAGETWETYEAWAEVKVGDVAGWIPADCFPMKSYANPALVRFAQPYAPLREGPSEEAPVAREDAKPGDRWRAGGAAAAGQYFFLKGKVADWYCLERGFSAIWAPADAPGLELFYLTYAWHPTDNSDFWFYLPGGDEVDRVFYLADTYRASGGLPWKDPRLEVVAAGETFELVPQDIAYSGGYECVDYYFEFTFPRPVRRDEIEAITFSLGDEGERLYFTVDPHDAWREPATKSHWPSRGMA